MSLRGFNISVIGESPQGTILGERLSETVLIWAVPIGQNAAIRQLLLISVCIFACVMSSEYTREFVMKFPANSVFLNSKNV